MSTERGGRRSGLLKATLKIIDLRRAPVVDDLMLKLKVEVVLCFVFDISDEKRSKWQPFFV